MSTSEDFKAKANEDFSKAEGKLARAFGDVVPPVTPDKASFVFVTSQTWDSGQWVKDTRAKSNWKSIRVIDAEDLRGWIEQCPSVMVWFADVCGLPIEGLYDSEQYLRKVGIAFSVPNITPELVIAGRTADADVLKRLVLETNETVDICGESAGEAAGFIAAVSLQHEGEFREKPPLVFADAAANLNLLATHRSKLMLVPVGAEAFARSRTVHVQGWRWLVPDIRATSAQSRQNQLILGPCKRGEMERCLKAQIGLSEHKARLIARETKGSLIALLWLVGSGHVGRPRWATRKDATTHASLMLAGAWMGNCPEDERIIERLSRKGYRDVETLLQSARVPEGPWMQRGAEWLCVSRDFVWAQLADNLTPNMLQDFEDIVFEVVRERDPSLDLPSSQRYMASLLGKNRKYSHSLRAGLVDSVARLALKKIEGQNWADRIVHGLLDPAAPDALDRWRSVRDVYSEIAEAAPGVFLECLDDMVRTGHAVEFFEENAGDGALFGPTSPHVGIVWALSQLAWQKEYFPRAMTTLARLAQVDPGGRCGPRPKETLANILMPWCPQHGEGMKEAEQILRTLYSVAPEVAWDVGIRLLPKSHDVSTPTPTPVYRDHPGERKVTRGEYEDFVRCVVESLIEWANDEMKRWAELVRAYPELRRAEPELGRRVTDVLERIDATKPSDAARSELCETLRGVISRHREHSDADWALPAEDLTLLEKLQERFQPDDLVLRNGHLFSWDPHLLEGPVRPYEDGWDEWIGGKRVEAVAAIYEQGGLEAVCRLAESVKVPHWVGEAAAKVGLAEGDVGELVNKGFSIDPCIYGEPALMQMAGGYISAKHRESGEEWLASFVGLSGIAWTAKVYANLGLHLPASPDLWKRLKEWGEDADRLYWENARVDSHLRRYWRQALQRLREVNRPWSSLELIGWVVDERHVDGSEDAPSAQEVIEVLGQAAEVGEDVEAQIRNGGMVSHWAEQAFLYLDGHGADRADIARLEWSWLRVLEHTDRGVQALQEQVTASPELFVDLLKVVYRAEGEPKRENVSEAELAMSMQASRLLHRIDTLPGERDEGDVKRVASDGLRAWVLESRRLAEDAGRLDVCDIQIGEILSFAPAAPDNSWPCIEVRDLIEEVQSGELERGLAIGKLNQRGAVFRGEGGAQERELAKEHSRLADMIRCGWPRTTAMLDGIAKHYEAEARQWDERARRDEYE